MLINPKFTRRSFLLLGLAPTALQAAPLVDIQNGLGLFSNTAGTNIYQQGARLSFFDDPEPELSTVEGYQVIKSGNISINKNLRLRLLNANTNETKILQFSKGRPISFGTENSLNEFFKDWRTS